MADAQLELSDLEFATNEHLYDDIYGEKDDFATDEKEHDDIYDIEHLYDDVFAPKDSQRRYDWEDWSRKELMTLYANHLNR